MGTDRFTGGDLRHYNHPGATHKVWCPHIRGNIKKKEEFLMNAMATRPPARARVCACVRVVCEASGCGCELSVCLMGDLMIQKIHEV